MQFNELGLNHTMLKAVQLSGYQDPSAIQSKTIPLILQGHDVIGQAQTGTGKTAAFALPILQKVDLKNQAVQALIVSPTRELAMQTGRAVKNFGKTRRIEVQAIFGGANLQRQARQLKRHPRVIVGTPGRIIDLLNRKKLDFSHLRTLVLDEADDMLNMGFLPNIKEIVSHIQAPHQTLLFSATMPKAIEKVGVRFMHNPEKIEIEPKGLTTDLIDQYYVRVRPFKKFAVLTRFFDVYRPQSTIVFCQTKLEVEAVAKGLVASGFRAEGLQGDLTQRDRSRVMNDFKHGQINVLVATDVAARGIDVSTVKQVYNFDIPQDPDGYVHRIGRTGRAGRHGIAVTFVARQDWGALRTIEKLTKVKIKPIRMPSEQDAIAGRIQLAQAKIGQIVKHKSLTRYTPAANKLLSHYNQTALVAALLSKIVRQPVQVSVAQPHSHRSFSNHRRRGFHNYHRKRGYHHRNNHGHFHHRSFQIKSRK